MKLSIKIDEVGKETGKLAINWIQVEEGSKSTEYNKYVNLTLNHIDGVSFEEHIEKEIWN